jgi:hypothetical protein
MKRRHPKKSNTWISKKYFKSIEGNNWVFYAEVNGKQHLLTEAARVPIKRHAKIKAEANPYDPKWEVLRKTPRCSHRRHPQRETLAHSSLERAKWTLPNVSAENHQDHRMA